jgi:hypothetical protein
MDDFIRNNAEHFNTEEPPEGHFDRFNGKLETPVHYGRYRFMTLIPRVAAILVLGIFITAVLYKSITTYHSALPDDNCPNRELCEAEDFYSRQVETYYNRIEKMPFNNDPKTREEVLKELREMDAQVVVMKEDLKQNPNDERVIHSIINYYQEKIDLMDMIIVRTTISKNTIL